MVFKHTHLYVPTLTWMPRQELDRAFWGKSDTNDRHCHHRTPKSFIMLVAKIRAELIRHTILP